MKNGLTKTFADEFLYRDRGPGAERCPGCKKTRGLEHASGENEDVIGYFECSRCGFRFWIRWADPDSYDLLVTDYGKGDGP